jgi:hypothetical protein
MPSVHEDVSHQTAKRSTPWAGPVETANATAKLKENSWAYASPALAATRIEQLDAGRSVQVTGTTHYFLQIKLQSGTTGYVPMNAADLDRPTDHLFKLTKDTPVLSAPTRYGTKLAEVHDGHDVHVIATALNYMRIRMKDGLEGYIATSALE